MLGTVNEKTSVSFACGFFDENGNPVTPTTASYQLDDIKAEGNTVITPVTSFTPGTLDISADENRILDASRPIERRMLTILWTWGGTKSAAHQDYYLVKNLLKVS